MYWAAPADEVTGEETAEYSAARCTMAIDAATVEQWEQNNIYATINPRDLSAQQMAEVAELWDDSIEPDATPMMTLKANTLATWTGPDLVIQPRKLARPEEPSARRADYELLDLVGEGGVGVVYSARQASIDRTVAVKMLKADTAKDREHREKFLSEAVVTGDLDHPNIVPVYDLGSTREGELFYSMKLVRGTPWSDVIGEKSLSENLEILLKVADAIAFAHARGVIHRDIKPENVMLGGFGEVLVMDWGIAISSSLVAPGDRRKAINMGGSPAYMAPEMATGPLERIGPASDIYLLGATLFEIITGAPPHEGKTVLECLRAAAKNEIRHTDKSGELLEIAFRALATEPKDRFATVQDFQEAVRRYQSHSESISLANRAERDLAEAREKGDYERFARARFAFDEALKLWPENGRAREGLATANLAYAQCALDKGDYDLGLSVLSPNDQQSAALFDQLQQAQKERDARQIRLRRFRRLAAALMMIILIGVTAFLLVLAEKNERLRQTTEDALAAKQQARDEADRTKREKQRADEETKKARLAEQMARQQKDLALDAEQRATREKETALYESYLARIGLAAAKIEENAFSDAMRILEEYRESPLRHWEWARLKYYENLAFQTTTLPTPVDALACAPDGTHVAVGRRGGIVEIRSLEQADPQVVIETGGGYIFDVAFSPDGRVLAVAGDQPGSYVSLWDVKTGKALERLEAGSGHTDWALSVSFSRDGRLLLSTSYDRTALVWDVASGQVRRRFLRHHRAVWDGAFSPDQHTIVTVSEDGTAIVWRDETGDWSATQQEATQVVPKFAGHQGPIYAVAFSPDGRYVATGGHDHRVLIWKPEEIEPFDYEGVLSFPVDREGAGSIEIRQNYAALSGHTGTIRSLVFTPDGQQLISGGQDNTVRVWDVQRRTLYKTLRGHSRTVSRCDLFADDTGLYRVVSASHDQTLKLWHLERYNEQRVLQAYVVRGHQDAVLAAAFDPSSQRIVTASRDQTARIIQLPTSDSNQVELQHILREGHEFLATRVIFFPDGKRLLTAGMDGTVRIWNVLTAAEMGVLPGTGQHAAVCLSSDGQWVATGSDQRLVKLWHLRQAPHTDRLDAALAMQMALPASHGQITAVALASGSPTRILACDEFGNCTLWECSGLPSEHQVERAQAPRWSVRCHSEAVVFASFVQTLNAVLTASRDGTIRVTDVQTGEVLDEWIDGTDQRASVLAMTMGPHEKTAASAHGDGTVRIWEVRSGKMLRQMGAVKGNALSLAGNVRRRMDSLGWTSKELATATGLPESTLKDVLGGRIESSREGRATLVNQIAKALGVPPNRLWQPLTSALDVAPDGQTLMTVSREDGTFRFWNMGSGELLADQPVIRSVGTANDATWSAAFSPDGLHIAAVGGRIARLWDRGTGEAVRAFSPHGAVAFARFSHDGRYVVTASWDGSAKVWDAHAGRSIQRLADQAMASVNSAVFSPDDRYILTASDDGVARRWNWRTGRIEPWSQPVRHAAALRFAAWSPDGQWFVTTSDDGTAKVWDGETGELQHELAGHRAAVMHAAFSPDSRWLVTGGRDQQAILWDVTTGRQLAHMLGHVAPINAVAFSPDSQRILTGSDDHTAKLWDTRYDSGTIGEVVHLREVLSLPGHNDGVVAVSFSPDGRMVLTAGRDGRVIVWPAVYLPPRVHFSAPETVLSGDPNQWWLDAKADLTAPHSRTLAGGRLLVQLDRSPPTDAVLSIQAGSSPVALRREGKQTIVSFVSGGTSRDIGRVTKADNGRALKIDFTDGVTVDAATTVLRHVVIQSSDAPASQGTYVVRCQVVDGDQKVGPWIEHAVRW